MEFISAVQKRINDLLKEKKMSVYDLVGKCGLPFPVVYSVLKKKRDDIDIDTLYSICKGFDISLADFFDSELFDKPSGDAEDEE